MNGIRITTSPSTLKKACSSSCPAGGAWRHEHARLVAPWPSPATPRVLASRSPNFVLNHNGAFRYARPSAGHVACWHVCRRITKFTIMCGRVIQSSGPLRYAIVDGMNVRDSRAHNYPPRWNAAPSVIALSEQHLLRVLKSYASYYNSARTHRSLDKDAPVPRPVQPIGRIVSHALVGGLHHQYARI